MYFRFHLYLGVDAHFSEGSKSPTEYLFFTRIVGQNQWAAFWTSGNWACLPTLASAFGRCAKICRGRDEGGMEIVYFQQFDGNQLNVY